jgi:ABC-type antimicrobial peptide transport system permease subunit
VISIRTLQQQVERTFDQQRAVATLAGLFGVIALVLAAVGLYGVTAFSVANRTGEIGLRMALGADRARVVALVLGGAFRLVAAGLLLGLPLAVGAGYLVSAQLYGVSFWDPAALGLAGGALGLAALVACIVPASRAPALEPMRALRTD